ncbi:MAG: hypothetical protein EHM12_08670 [Dehalococcoidia bacterium]|nr:MAG: hypothetical protein EHM12_08670 [Dehalococcoidia bacterium]
MKHDFIDKYCHLDSPLHRLDPRTKLLFAFALLLLFNASNQLRLFIFYYLLLAIGIGLSRVPLLYFLKRVLLVTPFVLMIALLMIGSAALSADSPPTLSPEDLGQPLYLRALLIVLKTYASVTVLTLLTSVTRFTCLLWAMRKFRFPAVITTLSRLIYTYIFVLIDEMHATFRSIKSRAPVLRLPRTRVYGQVAASILLKSLSRSQYVYYAMVARQFTGEFPEASRNRFGWADLWAASGFALVGLSIYLLWKR